LPLHTIAADALNAENAKIPTLINPLASIVFSLIIVFLLMGRIDAGQQSSRIIVPHPCPSGAREAQPWISVFSLIGSRVDHIATRREKS
jgi:hypothetical protein